MPPAPPPSTQMVEEAPKPIVILPEAIMKDIAVKDNNNCLPLPLQLPSTPSMTTSSAPKPISNEEVVKTKEEPSSLTNSLPITPLSTTPVVPSSSTTMGPISTSKPLPSPSLASSSSPALNLSNSVISNFGAAAAAVGLGFPPPLMPPHLSSLVGVNPLEINPTLTKTHSAASLPSTVSTPEKKPPTSDLKLMSPDFRKSISNEDRDVPGQMTPTTPSPGSSANFLTNRRANRTRFSDYQLKVLQEYFEQNAYPKDDDLEHLSKLLNLSPRVIVVWFQNARQKARKSYENNPPTTPGTMEDESKFNRTPALNYQCKKCFTVFQRYQELIRHQKHKCFKDDDDNRSETNMSSYTQDEDSSSSETSSQNQPPLSTTPKDVVAPLTPKLESNNHSLITSTNVSSMNPKYERKDGMKEHQSSHTINPNLFKPPALAVSSPLGVTMNPFTSFPPILPALPTRQQIQDHLVSLQQEDNAKRKFDDDDFDRDEHGQKRMRTTILPEQLEYLYIQYQNDCNPSRKQLEAIADHVGLKKRVVQVWFQNTRARERKGQYRAHTQLIHKRCPFCRALFRAKSAMESHLATKHPEEMARTQVIIDNIPDEPLDSLASSEGGSGPSTPTSSIGGNGSGTSGAAVPNLDMAKLLNNPYSIPNQFMPIMSGGGFDDPMHESMKQLYEESMKRYMADVTRMKDEAGDCGKNVSGRLTNSEEIPLDLSKPVDLSRSVSTARDDYDDEASGNESDDNDIQISMTDSGPPSPCSTNSSTAVTSPQDLLGSSSGSSTNNMMNIPPKRYRTQLSALQVKLMKSIYQHYKTPTMSECETLGRIIGLAKRVIQVWFQNARAKEKKAKSQYPSYSPELDIPPPPEECKMCNFKYTHQHTVQDHLFSQRHIENVSAHIKATDSDVANETTRNMWMNSSYQKMESPASAAPPLGLPMTGKT